MVKADVSEPDDCESLAGFVRDRFGRLDILVHNAASGGFRTLMESKDVHFDKALHTNTLSLLHLVQPLETLLVAGGCGKVVVLSSAGAHRAIEGYGLVGASKAALAALSRHLALELGPRGINVNILEAGLVDTDSSRNIPGAAMMLDARAGRSLVGARTLEASNVADAVLFLVSPLADLVQGQTLVVDAGASLHP
jgi:enoyl-[acyl-carrier protein] reductase III